MASCQNELYNIRIGVGWQKSRVADEVTVKVTDEVTENLEGHLDMSDTCVRGLKETITSYTRE